MKKETKTAKDAELEKIERCEAEIKNARAKLLFYEVMSKRNKKHKREHKADI